MSQNIWTVPKINLSGPTSFVKELKKHDTSAGGDQPPSIDRIKAVIAKLSAQVNGNHFKPEHWSQKEARYLVLGIEYDAARRLEGNILVIVQAQKANGRLLRLLGRLWMDRYDKPNWKIIGQYIHDELNRLEPNRMSELTLRLYDWRGVFSSNSPDKKAGPIFADVLSTDQAIEAEKKIWRWSYMPKLFWSAIPYAVKRISAERLRLIMKIAREQLVNVTKDAVYQKAIGAIISRVEKESADLKAEVFRFSVEPGILGAPTCNESTFRVSDVDRPPRNWQGTSEEAPPTPWLQVRNWFIRDHIIQAFSGDVDPSRRKYWLDLHSNSLIINAVRINFRLQNSFFERESRSAILLWLGSLLVVEFSKVGDASTFWHRDKVKFAPDGVIDSARLGKANPRDLKCIDSADIRKYGGKQMTHQGDWQRKFRSELRMMGGIR